MPPAPLPPSRCVTRWVNPLTPLTGPSAGRGAAASGVRARGRAATRYNWQWLRNFHKLIRQRKWSRGTTLPNDTDSAQVWAVEVGATVCVPDHQTQSSRLSFQRIPHHHALLCRRQAPLALFLTLSRTTKNPGASRNSLLLRHLRTRFRNGPGSPNSHESLLAVARNQMHHSRLHRTTGLGRASGGRLVRQGMHAACQP